MSDTEDPTVTPFGVNAAGLIGLGAGPYAYTFEAEGLLTRQSRDDVKRLDAFYLGNTISEKVVAPFAGYTITAAAS